MTISLSEVTLTTGMMTGEYTNLVPSPLDIFSWTGPAGANAATLSRDTVTGRSPAGGIPMLMAITGNDPYTASYGAGVWNLGTAASGQTWIATAYVKASTTTLAGFFIFGSTAGGGIVDYAESLYTATTSWSLISYSYTFTNPSVTNIQLRMDGPNSGGTGQSIWWDQLQLYRVS
jgi:hypothetical protein